MGQMLSGFQEFRESQAPLSAPSTPNTAVETSKRNGNCRLLEVDPRSPTLDINRTPIQVESTPKGVRGSSENDSSIAPIPFNMSVKERPKSLHQRIIEKKRPLENMDNTPNSASNQ